MINLERCLESLAFCHVQDDLLWASARIVAQQDIDEFLSEAGSDLTGQLAALRRLMEGFEAQFPGQTDPVLIRSTMRRHLRRIEFDLKREGDVRRQFYEAAGVMDAPAMAPEVFDEHLEATVASEVAEVHEDHPDATVALDVVEVHEAHQDATVAPEMHEAHQDVTVAPDAPQDVAVQAEPLPEKSSGT